MEHKYKTEALTYGAYWDWICFNYKHEITSMESINMYMIIYDTVWIIGSLGCKGWMGLGQ